MYQDHKKKIIAAFAAVVLGMLTILYETISLYLTDTYIEPAFVEDTVPAAQ